MNCDGVTMEIIMIECDDGYTDIDFDVDCEVIHITSNERELYCLLEICDKVLKTSKKMIPK